MTTSDAWDLPELDGDGRVTLASFEGTPTVVNFFADRWRPMAERHDIVEFTLVKDIDGDGRLLDVARGALNSQTLAARLASLGIA
ncbi:MAG: hypothetical protein GY929_25760 [Actinomycetia bacterium]|nr:hypothetical protein [Actinomycetes bacterium]